MLQDEILALLRSEPGAYRSGEEMSRRLGVSRAAVWKAVEALRSAGYEIVSAPNPVSYTHLWFYYPTSLYCYGYIVQGGENE